MRRDHRPYWAKRLYLGFRHWYAEWFLRPAFDFLGENGTFMKPWYVEVFGPNISLGHCPTVIANADARVRLTVWGRVAGSGRISIGDYALITPGVRISASDLIEIGHSCMIANGAYITDSDWHSLYDRVERSPDAAPVHIGNNVWIGDHATILKGVRIGDNSVIGANSVVVGEVPANVVVAGNPARIIKELDPTKVIRTRANFFADPAFLDLEMTQLDRAFLAGNSFLDWLRASIAPTKRD